MKLTNKQRVFVEEYLQCWNATEAARRADYRGSDATLAVIGSENIRKPYIRDEIDRRIEEKAMSADEVLLRLGDMARGSLEDCFVFIDGMKEPYLDLSKAKRLGKLGLVKKFVRDATGKVTIELYDAQAALVHLGRHHKLFTDKHEVSGPDGDVIRVSLVDD